MSVHMCGSEKGHLGTDGVTVCFVTNCEFVYCKEVTGGRKRRGRRLGTRGKSETNKEQKDGRWMNDGKCERKVKVKVRT
jgi:hypothetical protein